MDNVAAQESDKRRRMREARKAYSLYSEEISVPHFEASEDPPAETPAKEDPPEETPLPAAPDPAPPRSDSPKKDVAKRAPSTEIIKKKLQDAKRGLFSSSLFLYRLMEVIVRFRNMTLQNCLLITVQRPEAKRVCTEESLAGIGMQLTEAMKAEPILLYSIAPHSKRTIPQFYYDLALGAKDPPVKFSSTFFDEVAVTRAAAHLLDGPGLRYDAHAKGIRYDPSDRGFVAQQDRMERSELVFQAVQALCARELNLAYEDALQWNENTQYIAEIAGFIVLRRVGMRLGHIPTRIPESYTEKDFELVKQHLELARSVADYMEYELKKEIRKGAKKGAKT